MIARTLGPPRLEAIDPFPALVYLVNVQILEHGTLTLGMPALLHGLRQTRLHAQQVPHLLLEVAEPRLDEPLDFPCDHLLRTTLEAQERTDVPQRKADRLGRADDSTWSIA